MTTTADRDLSTNTFWSGFDMLWGLGEPPASGASVDRDRIVAAAISIADAGGLEAVSMRRIAASIGRGVTSIYRQVPDKDALVSLMIETVLAESLANDERTPLPTHWRDGLRMLARSTWRLTRAHPWYPIASMTRPPLTPSAVAGLEIGLSFFDDVPIDIGTKMEFVGAVHFGVLSAALNTSIQEQALFRAQMSDEEAMAAADPFMRQMVKGGKFPRVAGFLDSADRLEDEAELWSGVELILDGIAARLDSGRKRFRWRWHR